MRVFIIKPDAIGDFILASGCIRLIAREAGEENLVLAVRSDVAPLAKSQFPKALILPLTLREKRRILNVTTINILHSLPSWLRMLSLRVDAALCLRSMRAYLHTIWFYTPRAQRRIACENLLLAQPRFRRPAVENVVTRFFKPALLPYPSPGKLPTDIEANRSVAVEFLGRKISDAEILPSLNPPSPIPRSDRWLLCPFSSSITKDYPAENGPPRSKSSRPNAAIPLSTSPPAQPSRNNSPPSPKSSATPEFKTSLSIQRHHSPIF